MTDFIYLLVYGQPEGAAKHTIVGSAIYLDGLLRRGAHYGAGELSHLMNEAANPLLKPEDVQCLGESQAIPSTHLLQWAKLIGESISDLVNFIDPQAVVLGGNLAINNHLFIHAMEQAIVSKLVLRSPPSGFRLIPAISTNNCIASGAALNAVEHFLQTAAM